MLRLTVFCLCVALIWASPSIKNEKVFPNKLTGPRIVNGNTAQAGQFPWQASLIFDAGWFCGGSIISSTWILTAGHCVSGANSATVHTGTLSPQGGTQSRSSQLILHERYDGDQLANDIGLVRLSSALTFNSNTAAIPLGGALGSGDAITVSGWGLTSDSASTVSNQLNYVNLVTISNSQCSTYYGSIGSEIVCATSPDSQIRSTCSGDSGGPVVSGGRHVAVVSFVSSRGCESGAPSGYTRTANYLDWINQHTGI